MPVISPGTVKARTGTAREAITLISAGIPAVILAVPGWLHSKELRSPVVKRVRSAARALAAGPVHARWLWLAEDSDRQQETAFLVWPCLTDHQPQFQCLNGKITHGNNPLAQCWKPSPARETAQGVA